MRHQDLVSNYRLIIRLFILLSIFLIGGCTTFQTPAMVSQSPTPALEITPKDLHITPEKVNTDYQTTSDPNVLLPTTAWLVETTEDQLGSLEQILLSDTTSQVKTSDSIEVLIEGNTQQLDFERHQELYLYFPIEKIEANVSGFFVIALRANGPGQAKIDAAHLRRIGQDRWQVEIQGESSLHLIPWGYYADAPIMENNGLASNGKIVKKYTKLSAFPFENDFFSPLSREWKNEASSYLNPQFLPVLHNLNIVSQALQRIDTEFNQPQPVDNLSNVWQADYLNTDTIAMSEEEISKRSPTANIYIRLRYPHGNIDYGDSSLRYDFDKQYIVVDGDSYYPASVAIRVFVTN